MRTLVVAHRGGAELVERGNTIEAFEMAISVGAPMAELDVHRTADDVCVVHHDAVIGDLHISRNSRQELCRVARQAGYELSTLSEVLETCRDRIRLDIEIKTPGFEAPLLREVHQYFEPSDVVFKSFHDRTVKAIKALAPQSTAGLLVGLSDHWTDLPQIATELFPEIRVLRCGADFVSPNHRLLRAGFVRRLHALGIPVWVWTVNDPRRIAKLMGRVDAIITDRPDIAMALAAGNPVA